MRLNEALDHPERIWGSMEVAAIPGSLPTSAALKELVAQSHRILEVGCGSGGLAAEFPSDGNREWIGFDINAAGIAEAVGRGVPRATFTVHDGLLPWPVKPDFDLIIIRAVVTCFPTATQLATFFGHLRQVVTPGRTVVYLKDFLQTWDEDYYANRYKDGMGIGMDRGSFVVRGENNEVIYAAHHFDEPEVRTYLTMAGLSKVDFQAEIGSSRTGKAILTFTAIAR